MGHVIPKVKQMRICSPFNWGQLEHVVYMLHLQVTALVVPTRISTGMTTNASGLSTAVFLSLVRLLE